MNADYVYQLGASRCTPFMIGFIEATLSLDVGDSSVVGLFGAPVAN